MEGIQQLSYDNSEKSVEEFSFYIGTDKTTKWCKTEYDKGSNTRKWYI